MKSRVTSLMRRLISSRPFSPATFIEVERAERLFYQEYLRERMTVFDVGANIGELTLMFSRLVGAGGCVHAFEPSCVAFDRLESMCTSSSLTNVRLERIALGEQEGTVILHSYGDDYLSWTSQADRPLENYGINVHSVGSEEAPATTIDIYCETNQIPSIDLLKVDVEGAEFQVLLGARRMLAERRVGCIAFEFGQTTFDMGNDPNDVEAYLNGLGYPLRNLMASDPVFPGRESAQTACFSMHVAMPADESAR